MRSTWSIESILGNRSRVAVLRVLLGVSVPLNASQIAARTHLTRPAVAAALEDLASAGIVRSSSAGRANVHTLVRTNVLVRRIIEPAFSGEATVADELVEYLRVAFADKAESVVLFGSYARGDQDPTSDVDVVLVASDAHAKERLEHAAYDLLTEFHERFGAHLSPLVYDLKEAGGLANRAPDLLASLRADGVTIHGMSAAEWGKHA